MIQPVSTLSSLSVIRGSNVACGQSSKENTNPRVTILNVCAASIAVGGLTAAVARSHTSSWANAIVLGLFGTFLSLFFMTPQIVSNKNKVARTKAPAKKATMLLQEDSSKISVAEIKKCLKPAKKIVQFGQS